MFSMRLLILVSRQQQQHTKNPNPLNWFTECYKLLLLQIVIAVVQYNLYYIFGYSWQEYLVMLVKKMLIRELKC